MLKTSNNEAVQILTEQGVKKPSILYRGVDGIITTGGIVAGIFILLATGMIFYEIVSRSLFNSPTIWSTELSIYAIIGSCFIGSAYAIRKNAHIKVDLLLHNVPASVQKVLIIISGVLSLLFCLIFTWFSWEHVQNSRELEIVSNSLLRIPMYIPELLLPIGGILMCLAFILQIIDYVNGKGVETE